MSLRAGAHQVAPDMSCGKGFDGLVAGSQKYYTTATNAIWTHPGRTGQSGTFEQEIQCWFANMNTQKCGGMPSQHGKRTADLTAKCSDVQVDWLQVWNLFSKDEIVWYKKNFPAESLSEDEGDKDAAHYKQAMKTMVELNKKELLCLTLFTIDDECVNYEYIRNANGNARASATNSHE